nr:DUF2326 domain-containing protein [uncultured Rhodopila sp.]
MQISRIYSNKPNIFPSIEFNYRADAVRLNVVYGEVHHPADEKRTSHNLGKTTLLHLIDFMMLKGQSSEHFLFAHKERFETFIFFIEIALNDGSYATIRRSPAAATKIALKKHSEPGLKFADVAEDFWDHADIAIENAIMILDGWLDLRLLKPYDYRMAITYFLRAQGDFDDELQLGKFRRGRDREWKPFVAHLFGFNEAPVQRKYELDESISKLKADIAEKQAEIQFKENDLPGLNARIAVLQKQTDDTERELDAFSFDAEEKRIVKELVDGTEIAIAETNDRIYNLRYDISQINEALSHDDRFNLKEVEEIFNEAQLYFPDQLKHEYQDLVDFNRKITRERNVALRARHKELTAELDELEGKRLALDQDRRDKLRLLRSTDTMEKFKSLQNELTHARAQIVYLTEQRKKLDQLADVARQMREQERERGRVVDELKTMVARPTTVCERFTSVFNGYCQRVLNLEGLFYFEVNKSDNLDYVVGLSLPGQSGPSSQSKGTSFKKMVCALFDLALLKVYEDLLFFHFVYHDGILEGLDNRQKRAFLSIVREHIASKKTQYILTLIDSDIPRDEKGDRIDFPEDEIVLRLTDEGKNGRLFKMAEF